MIKSYWFVGVYERNIIDAMFDTIKLISFLFVAFLFLQFLEHKMSKKNSELLVNNCHFEPVIGGIFGFIIDSLGVVI